MGSDEKKRIKELLKERERDDGMMDWMYKTAKPDAEEYLLGRKIDKIFEQEEEPPEDKNDPGAIFNERVKANIAMDMAAKMREDPLFQIKKREEDAKKTLLQNPVRMRQLQKLVKEKEKSKHKKKKKKHKRKKAQSSDDESDDDDDGDDDIMKKYLAVLSKKHKPKSAETSGGGRQKQRNRGDNQDDDEDDSKHRSRKERKERRKKHSLSPEMSKSKNHYKTRERREHRKSSSPSPNHLKAGSKQYGLLLRGENLMVDEPSKRSKSPRRSRSRSFEQKRSPIRKKSPKAMSRSALRKRSRSPVGKRSRSPLSKRSRSRDRRRSRSPVRRSRSPQRKHSRSPYRKHSRSPVRRRSPHMRRSRSPVNERSWRTCRSRSPSEKGPKRKLTEEDKLRKLEEMQENAKWRDSQREKNVKRYRAEAEAEEKSHLNKGNSTDFLNPLMAGHVSQSSVQDRIKRNIYNVQRTKADLDKDFTRR